MSESNDSVSNVVSVSDSDTSNIESVRLEAEKVLPSALGDFAGALSWQIPLSVDQKKQVLEAVRVYIEGLDDLPRPGQGLLELLNIEQPLSPEILRDPAKAVETLIAGARGQALGLAVQTRLKGYASDVSVNDYALAAVQLHLDPQSIEIHKRNSVAGFDLDSKQHWGKPVTAVFDKLREHLIKELSSNPEMSGLGAYILLAKNAPVFLIKNTPAGVKYGGPAWFNLAVAAATIEAQSPGKVANMTFAQVMVYAESAALRDPAVAQYAQTITLADWSVVHGLMNRKEVESYTEAQLRELKETFNSELADRLNTPMLLSSEFPNREKIARVALEKKFGKGFPIEERVLDSDANWAAASGTPVAKGKLHTLLDAAMMRGGFKWDTRDPFLVQHLHTINTMDLRVPETFDHEFETTLNNLKKGTQMSVRRLISELPLEDRENLEYGKIDFYQDKTIKLATDFWNRKITNSNQTLTLRVERGIDKKVSVYCIDLGAAAITRRASDPAISEDRVDVHIPSVSYGVRLFQPANNKHAEHLKQIFSSSGIFPVPSNYSSNRSHIIADAFVEHLDFDNEDIRKAAEGQTTWDKELAVLNSRVQFLLNLIPFKSAVSNFIDGKYADGAIDLFLDVLGFVTAGVSVAAKLTKVAATTTSALRQALKAAKIIGVLVIGELNPLSVLVAGGKLLGAGIKYVGVKGLQQFDKFRDAVFGYDLLIGVSKQHGPAALGTFKVGEQSIESVGVLKGSSWHPYNTRTQRLYGAPGNFRPSGSGGFGNAEMGRFTVKSSVIAGLEANARGIFRSTDGQSFYIRNIDGTGQEAFYQIKNDFSLSADLTDVILVDRVTNRAHGSRLWQVAPDQWQPVSLRGGDLSAGATEIPAGAIVDESASFAARLVHTSRNALGLDLVFTRGRLPNGLWEPVIETINNRQTAHLPFDWGQKSTTHYSIQRTSIHQALSATEFSRLSVVGSLTKTNASEYSASIKAQLARTDGGANFFFVMERIQPANSVGKEFNALKIHDLEINKLPVGANAVSGYWMPQGGYVDIPVHPEWGQPDYLFTPDFTGCSLVVDQLDTNLLRVRHVEGAKEFAQYNGLPAGEHGWGLSTSMEFQDYGFRVDANGRADSLLTGFAFMKYDRQSSAWKLHFQSVQGGPRIGKHSSAVPGWRTPPETVVEVFSDYKVMKVVNRPVMTIVGATAG
ncbi:hypothetical protein [Pseudomonas fluorescens]